MRYSSSPFPIKLVVPLKVQRCLTGTLLSAVKGKTLGEGNDSLMRAVRTEMAGPGLYDGSGVSWPITFAKKAIAEDGRQKMLVIANHKSKFMGHFLLRHTIKRITWLAITFCLL